MSHSSASIEPDFDRLVVFGAGGHGREIAALARECIGQHVMVDFVVDEERFLRRDDPSCPVFLLQDYRIRERSRFVAGLGNPADRERAATACSKRGLTPASLIHPLSESGSDITRGAGSVICAGTVLTTNVHVGAHAHINVGCTISHDTRIGDFSTLSPGVHVAGNVRIGRGVFIGIGASIINGTFEDPLVVGDGAVIAAGACVIRPVEGRTLVAGVPARIKRLLDGT